MLRDVLIWTPILALSGSCLADDSQTTKTVTEEILTFAAFSRDNQLITTSYFEDRTWVPDRQVYLVPLTYCQKADIIARWELNNGDWNSRDFRDRLANAAFAPSGSHLLTWDSECTDDPPEGTVKVFSAQPDIEHIHTIGGPAAYIEVAFVERGKQFLVRRRSRSDDELLPTEVYDLDSLKVIGTIAGDIRIENRGFEEPILYDSRGQTLRTFTMPGPEVNTVIRAPYEIYSIQFSKDGQYTELGVHGGGSRIYRLADGVEISTSTLNTTGAQQLKKQLYFEDTPLPHGYYVRDVQHRHPDTHKLLKRRLDFYDTKFHRVEFSRELDDNSAVVFSPDGRYACFLSGWLWDRRADKDVKLKLGPLNN